MNSWSLIISAATWHVDVGVQCVHTSSSVLGHSDTPIAVNVPSTQVVAFIPLFIPGLLGAMAGSRV